MTQRNPMNERYQREDLGKTRKSAASAKPVAKAAASVRIEGQKSQSGGGGLFSRAQRKANAQASNGKRRETPEERALYYNPDTAEFRKWRRIWFALIIAALVFTTLSFVAQIVFHFEDTRPTFALLIIGYACIFGAIWVDLARVRKIRKGYRQTMAADRSKEATRARKAARAEAAKRAEEERQAQEARQAEAEQRRANRKGIVNSLVGKIRNKETIPAPSDPGSEAE